MAQAFERPLTTSEVAALLCVTDATVINYADKGLIKHWRLPSGQRRFYRRDIERFMPPPLIEEPEDAA